MTEQDARRGQVNSSAAEVYEEFFVPALFGQFASPVLDAADVTVGHRVLDVGCGTGVVARAAAARVGPTGSVVGLDRNPGMLSVARRDPASVTWTEGLAEDLPFADGDFDRVVCQFVLMFVDDVERTSAELRRVLAPDGRLAVATWAALEESPGYAAMVDLLDREVGPEAAQALRAPFALGSAESLAGQLRAAFPDVVVRPHEGTARFASIDAWLHTDIRGWTLAGSLDDTAFDSLLAAARAKLAGFADTEGRVSFAAPALVATAGGVA